MLQGAVKQGILVAVVVMISCILGIVAAFKIPVQMIPDLDVRTITVVTEWPGATPQDVEKEILIEQERYLRSLPNLKRMSSYANTGEAEVELEFPFGADVNEALINVSNALAQVPNYPDNVDQPVLYSSSFSSNAFMFFTLKPLAGNPLNLDIDMLRDFTQDNVRPEMERVTGVSQVSIRGGALYQVQILVDQQKLASRNISLTDVRDAIKSRNLDASAGDIDSGKRRYLLRMVGRFQSAQALEELVIAQDQDSTVKLKDIATVTLDHYELRDVAYNDGERNLMLMVRRESGSNVIAIKDEMLQVVERLNHDLLEKNGLQLTLLSDDVRYVKGSIENVWTNLALGALLATLVMFWFLKSPRSTIIGVMGVPICTIAAFLGLLLFNRTINVISLAGVAFAIGMTVDNTIVVLENIEQAKRRGLSKFKAAITGVQEVWPAVLASTLTTVLVFAPILFIVQEAGQLYSDVAIAISAAIIASMLVALLVVPAAFAKFSTKDSQTSAMTTQMHLPAFIKKFLASTRQRFVCVVFAIVGLIGGAWLFMPEAEYLPEGEEPKAFSMMIAPPGYNLTYMEKIGDELLPYFNKHLNAPSSDFEQGKTDLPSLKYYSMSIGVGSIWFLSEPSNTEHIDAMMKAITQKFKSYPGMRAFSSRGSIISSNDGGTRAVAIDISGPEQVNLYRAADAIYRLASDVFDNPQVDSEPSSLTLDQPLIEIQPRWQRLAEVGMSADELGYTIAALSDGAYVDELIINDDKVDIFIFSEAGNKQSLSGLEQAPVVTKQGLLPLNALANLNEKADSDSLRRVDGRRTVTVYIIPPRDVALERAQQIVREELLPQLQKQGDLLPDVNITIGGAADQLEKTRDALSGNFIVALALCYLLLVAIFKHWGQPLFIMATVPLGMAGGLLGLVITNSVGSVVGGFHQPFDMITMLGFLILLGTVVNNPILIVDQSRRNLASGLKPYKAVINALETRLKPIVMSTMTTLCGLAPLVFLPGEGSELYRGVGIIVLGGITVSTLVSLTVLPAMLLMFYKQEELR
ncbi:efflux RND transporter permease subunit [Colwellia sp. 4_MG-2023]|uniref:efflux RND transporter permease subunit n=1 Tax=unclassified Colwellia TaxID=196834 RepID=UPI001C0A36C9|nr:MULTISPECIES: efflux RND transporter permease subunit [unclassified Colwellia]MBU2924958.1 efflux RND transporter permease subunit [Colwellia sp. C2M11]MDO6506857.1 efflux RND transporter permease subunit [Colwellia sp. 5_MG-2023]MDO6555768.1 efflux RND transporter permease subunit [Colwellia sp. 4_MG-2023]MDO6652809.1 efflux RND transporter permease subunit [Colwellia sp. 3_MG-2023]MDO6665812.1 efflux RND transporter permease subunit [Colwellia sp. 2_MG-2023]